ncbi:MAG: carbohydrate ABC transporter permease [Proteobacteria bacterium]|nr:carbohydrate ABC transporter permease [Pseudomonadota bacterium]
MIRSRHVAQSVVAGACVAIYLFPLYWMAISGFKTQAEIFADPPSFFPRAPTLDAFRYVVERENMGRYVWNSVAIAIPVMLVAVTLSAMGAYAMSRMRSRLVDAALIAVLLLQVLPEALLATPVFIIFKTMGLLNTHLAVVLATSARAVAFGLVILRPMFRQVPYELEEASYVDGCSEWQTFSRIVLPLMRVPLMVLAAITFAQAYGQFVYPLTLLNRQDLQPGTVGIYSFIGTEIADWHRVMAFAALFALPILLLFMLLQRQIVSGLTAGALK